MRDCCGEKTGTTGEKSVSMSTQITPSRGWRHALVFAALSAMAATGCDTASAGAGLVIAERSGPGGGEGLWINNGLGDPSVGGIDPGYPLTTTRGMSETEGVLANDDTRITGKYLVECALPLGASITKTVEGQELVLEGRLGLAPEWEDGVCDEDCQQWVSACLLARTNVSERSIHISLRADHPAIGLEGHSDFPIYEASFFGNLFVAPEGLNMCRGTEDETVLAALDGRTCSSNPQSCGFAAYDDCESEDRCTFVEGEDGAPTAVGCMPESSTTAYHTISVYVMEPGTGE